MIGRLIDGRYQIRSRIARGGMATVYLATDLRLERRVALKIMHGHLADDSQFKSRFIQEARSAARLGHPNVVNVFDQGQDSDMAYLVMEYLPGITLRELLQEHRVLTTEQAIDIMEAVLSGLAAAHAAGIVHRDLKPENVLLADDGRIKIGDFGLARAATANTATGAALLGTIAYLSPELITRGIADTRSDIYAVGIMLYEMLAGEQPFRGEQPVQIAYQHANDTVPTPSTKNPKVPVELDELVLWATAREPDQRPRDARAMLEQLRETQRLLETAPDRGAQRTATQRTVPQRTAVLSALTRSFGASPTSETQVLAPRSRSRTGPVVADSATTLARKTQRRRAKGFWLFGLVVLLAAMAGGTGWYFGSGPGSKVLIPELTGETVAAARAALTGMDLAVAPETASAYSTEVDEGLVVGTDPAQGVPVVKGGSVTLIVSGGPQPLPIPKLVGLSEDDAIKAVEEAKFTPEKSRTQFSSSVKEGVVIAAYGADDVDLTKLETYGEKQPVTLLVSLGPIPDVSGMSLAQAKDFLSSKGLIGAEAGQEYSSTVDKGHVIRGVLKGSGPAKPGSTIDLIVSKGIEQVKVPDVVGKKWSTAKQALLDKGFKLNYPAFYDFGGGESFYVTDIDPDGGSYANKGSTVTVTADFGRPNGNG